MFYILVLLWMSAMTIWFSCFKVVLFCRISNIPSIKYSTELKSETQDADISKAVSVMVCLSQHHGEVLWMLTDSVYEKWYLYFFWWPGRLLLYHHWSIANSQPLLNTRKKHRETSYSHTQYINSCQYIQWLSQWEF